MIFDLNSDVRPPPFTVPPQTIGCDFKKNCNSPTNSAPLLRLGNAYGLEANINERMAMLWNKSMRILNVRHLNGISAWFEKAAVWAVVGNLPDGSIDDDRLLSLACELQGLCLPPYLAQVATGSRKDCQIPRDPAELVVDLAGKFQFLCGEFHGARLVRPASAGARTVVLECRAFALAEACLRASVATVNALFSGREPALSEKYTELLALAEQFSTASLPGLVISTALDRGIPVVRLGPDHAFNLSPDEVLQLGEGVHQKRLHPWGTMTDRTGFVAGHLANDKAFVKTLWSQYGIPVPEGSVVTDECGAQRAAETMGGPIVIKPVDAESGRGLTLRPATPQAVSAAFFHAQAASASGQVLVERFVAGAWHRLLVINQRLVAAVRREPASIVGDGRHTIRELVALANRDRLRGPDHRWPLRFLSLDETELENLAAAGLGGESVLPSGARAFLRQTASAASGAESFDVTEHVHPETARLAVEAAGLVGLDIAGLDLLCGDIRQPLSQQQGAFLEINEQPGIYMHAAPLCSPPRPVGEAIVESLFPGGRDGRVPLVVVVGRGLADSVAEFLASLLASAGRVIGLSTPEATRLDEWSVLPGSPDIPERLSVLMRHPRTEAVVVSAPLEDIVQSGLGTDRCTVLVLVGGPADCTGNGQAELRDDADRLLERLLRSASRTVVNISDSFWQKSELTCRRDVCLVARQEDLPSLSEHVSAGGTAAVLETGGMSLQTGGAPPQFFPAEYEDESREALDTGLAGAIAMATYVSFTRIVGTAGGERFDWLTGVTQPASKRSRVEIDRPRQKSAERTPVDQLIGLCPPAARRGG